MIAREMFVLLDTLAKVVIKVGNILDTRYKSEMRVKIRNVLTSAAENEFADYLSYSQAQTRRNNHIHTWEITSNPLDLQSDKRHAEWKGLLRLQTAFINRLRDIEGGAQQQGLPFPEGTA